MSAQPPIFLTLEDVLNIHARQIALFGGDPALRDMGLLESALAQPQQAFGGQLLHEGLAAMASAYLFHIAQNHPFADGNKRAAAGAALVFLEVNGVPIEAHDDELEALVIDAVTGKIGKPQIADFFRKLAGDKKIENL
jgi:death-on-curing protein